MILKKIIGIKRFYTFYLQAFIRKTCESGNKIGWKAVFSTYPFTHVLGCLYQLRGQRKPLNGW